ncbi:MAG: twin-arginine translocase TatA/TatE family subunit [Aigarchaeota archaeon]|nr:twin-arginine translocase TatA/TatE family subunit [Aigarchaeota archaeon]MDH5704199.1 twin-arginine translocase TatA/TatE family subunit [Aigarchaeota archaeon]
MAVVGWEWIVIIAIVLVFLLWGPQKIPQLARAIGEARREFDKASKESEKLVSEVVQPAKPVQPSQQLEEDQALIEIAGKLGIATEGKTRSQLLNEILQTLSKAMGGKSASAA